jgi:hypothetical protein
MVILAEGQNRRASAVARRALLLWDAHEGVPIDEAKTEE